MLRVWGQVVTAVLRRVCCVSLCCLPLAASAAKYPPPEGLLVEAQPAEGSARAVKATGVIRSKPEAVWLSLTDYDAFPDYMPNIRKTKVQRQEGNTYWVANTFNITIKNLNYVVKIVQDRIAKPWKISWTRDSGDMEVIDGHYVLHEVPEGTRLEYASKVDSGFPMPGFVQDALIKRSIPNLYDAVAQRSAMHERNGVGQRPEVKNGDKKKQ
jgi:hypothetical protein